MKHPRFSAIRALCSYMKKEDPPYYPRGYVAHINDKRYVSASVTGRDGQGIHIWMVRELISKDVEDGKLVPLVSEKIHEKDGSLSRITQVDIAPETARALSQLLAKAADDAEELQDRRTVEGGVLAHFHNMQTT